FGLAGIDKDRYVRVKSKEMSRQPASRVLVANYSHIDEYNDLRRDVVVGQGADSIRDSFKGVNGKFYSFINYEREAEQVIREYLQKGLTPERVEELCFQEVTYWEKDAGWLPLPKKEFVKRFYKQLEDNLHQLNIKPKTYFFSLDGLNPFIFDTPLYAKYFDNCGFSNEWKYPTVNLVLDNSEESARPQTHMHFLRTEKGFKLIMVS